ncbi:exodeoxyribonuclease VII small subunit [Urbifossiella limnaea]|uniref:Exodeoxyribonuclease 7 small subunit n=1 Tax=Urbifossiella limnaea TaxID=2528023 RepID=A0A517XXP6_9BACT|nr:Exodeoxyribonuclease 7 small subunit [Urbifossiella limnaea]
MTPSDAEPVRFEQALAELDRILRELEDGTTTLDDALARYERGVALLRLCYGKLKDAEQRVRLLNGTAADGSPDLRLFEHVATLAAATASLGKPLRGAKLPGIDG